MPVQPMAAQDKKENDKKNETVIVGGTPSASLTFAADSTTERTVTAGGQTIAYRAVAGTLTVGSNDVQDALLGPDGKALPSSGETLPEQATARMFYVAYFNKDAGARRPITFIYNGGPGGASLPLHMGAFGCRGAWWCPMGSSIQVRHTTSSTMTTPCWT
jgi:carboxypeptidase C (cathepsin A)